jgi:hypothetical protein
MNVERLTELAEWLEAGAPIRNGVDGYDISDFSQPAECGTAFCLAGAVIQWHFPGGLESAESSPGVLRLSAPAMEILGLSRDQANALFFPVGLCGEEYTDTAYAARVLRHLIATGEVAWSAMLEAT